MSRYQILLQKRADLINEAKALFDVAAKEKQEDGSVGRPLNEAEVKRDGEIQAELDAIASELTLLERQRERERQVETVEIHNPQASGGGTPRVTVQDLADEDPNRGFKTHRDFMLCVMRAGMGREDTRLRPLRVVDDSKLQFLNVGATAGSDEQGVYSDPYGGYAIPTGFVPNMLRLEPEGDWVSGRVTRIPMANPTVIIPARVDKDHSSSVTGGFTVSRRAETAAISASRMEMERITLQATSLFGMCYATEEILSDSPISFFSLIQQGFADEFTSKLLNERINGTGVGEFEGVLNSPAVVSITKETGQAADTIVFENIVKMRARVYRYPNAVWMANQDTAPQLMHMVQVVGTGGSAVWQPSAREDMPDMLMGRPLYFTEYCPTLGDAGDIACINWGEYLEGLYQPLQGAESIHVRFTNHERTFKFWMRNAGCGWWRSALTPKKSTTTLSPFVKLGART